MTVFAKTFKKKLITQSCGSDKKCIILPQLSSWALIHHSVSQRIIYRSQLTWKDRTISPSFFFCNTCILIVQLEVLCFNFGLRRELSDARGQNCTSYWLYSSPPVGHMCFILWHCLTNSSKLLWLMPTHMYHRNNYSKGQGSGGLHWALSTRFHRCGPWSETHHRKGRSECTFVLSAGFALWGLLDRGCQSFISCRLKLCLSSWHFP